MSPTAMLILFLGNLATLSSQQYDKADRHEIGPMSSVQCHEVATTIVELGNGRIIAGCRFEDGQTNFYLERGGLK